MAPGPISRSDSRGGTVEAPRRRGGYYLEYLRLRGGEGARRHNLTRPARMHAYVGNVANRHAGYRRDTPLQRGLSHHAHATARRSQRFFVQWHSQISMISTGKPLGSGRPSPLPDCPALPYVGSSGGRSGARGGLLLRRRLGDCAAW
jgi:hypothetical protein